MADVGPHHFFIQSYCGDEIPSCPEVLSTEVLAPPRQLPRYAYRARARDTAHHITHRMFRWNADANMHMIGHQVPFYDLAILLPRELAQHLSEMLSYRSKYRFLAPLRYEHYVIFTVPARVRQALVLFHGMLPFLGRIGSIYDRNTRSNLRESPGRAGGLPQLVKRDEHDRKSATFHGIG